MGSAYHLMARKHRLPGEEKTASGWTGRCTCGLLITGTTLKALRRKAREHWRAENAGGM